MPKRTPTYTDPWYLKPGYVYFLGAGEPLEAIKIGVTLASGFAARLRNHQSSNHQPLRILGVIAYTGDGQNMRLAELEERRLHQLFSVHQRFLPSCVGSEWFNPHSDILAWISEHCVSCESLGLIASIAKHGPGLRREA